MLKAYLTPFNRIKNEYRIVKRKYWEDGDYRYFVQRKFLGLFWISLDYYYGDSKYFMVFIVDLSYENFELANAAIIKDVKKRLERKKPKFEYLQPDFNSISKLPNPNHPSSNS